MSQLSRRGATRGVEDKFTLECDGGRTQRKIAASHIHTSKSANAPDG